MNTIGTFPRTLFRAFDKEEYARAFLDGELRFGSLSKYRRIESEQRRDVTEGIGHIVQHGADTKVMFASNSFYVLSFHLTLDAALKTNHGKYIVEIHEPEQLANDVTKVLSHSSEKHYGGVEGVTIEYNKGANIDRTLSSHEKSRLSYCQKPSFYSHEKEFRFVICRKQCADDYYQLQVGRTVSGEIKQFT